MTTVLHQPTLTEGLTLLGWRLKRDAEIRERKKDQNFECEVEPTSTSYAAFEYMSTADEAYDPYAGLNIDLCLEVDAIDLNQGNQSNSTVQDDYDPYEVFMRMNTRRTVTGRDRAPLAVLPSHSTSTQTIGNNYRNYNFADDDTPVKYPLAIGHIDRRPKPPPTANIRGGYTPRPTFEEDRRVRPPGMTTSSGVTTTGSMPSRPLIPAGANSYRQTSNLIPRRGGAAGVTTTSTTTSATTGATSSSSFGNARGAMNHQMRRNIPPPPRLYPRSEYPPSASAKRVTFRHGNDYNSGEDFDEEEEDDDSLEGDLHPTVVRRNKPPRRTAARLAVQRFRAHNIRSSIADDDLDDDIAPTVTEMDMLEDQELDEDEANIQTISKSMSSPVKVPPVPTAVPVTKSTGGTSKSSYIGNMLPSFYEQLPESKKMLLQDATIDSSSTSPMASTTTTTTSTTNENSTKNSIDMVSPGTKQIGLTTEQIQGPGGEEIIDEENRLQFRNTTISQPYKRTSNYQNSKRYYENEDDDDQQIQMRKRLRGNDDEYSNATNQRQSQYNKQQRYRKYEEDEEYDISQDAQQQEEEFQQTIRVPARRGRPPSQHHHQQQQQHEDPKDKYNRIIAQFEEQHGLKLGEMRVYAPKLRLRISNVNVNWINLPPVPKFPNKVHPYST